MRYVTLAFIFCAAAAHGAGAQELAAGAKQAAEREVTAGRVQNTRIAVETRVTPGAPYSAEAVTESVQVLADGNRIVMKSATRIFRDKDGRIRREQLNPAGTDIAAVNISDPVAGTTYVLDPTSRTAYRNGLIFTTATDRGTASVNAGGSGTIVMTRTPDSGVRIVGTEIEAKVAAEAAAVTEAKLRDEVKARVATGSGGAGFVTETFSSAGGVSGMTTFVTNGVFARTADNVKQATREELGEQMIEGVKAVGTRTTTEIAAGAIGNEQPIRIVSEQWFSPELQVLVLTRHTDPRVGETVYRLIGIARDNPARTLFDIPADYTLQESTIKRQDR